MSEALTEFEQSILDNVEQYGCHLNGVFDPDGRDPDFSYSTGFTSSVDQPEVIIFGLELNLMQALLNDTLELCRQGFDITENARTDALIEGYSCVFRRVLPEWIVPEFWSSAIWYNCDYLSGEFDQAVQLVWPDESNRFPWEKGVSAGYVEAQPALYEPRIAA